MFFTENNDFLAATVSPRTALRVQGHLIYHFDFGPGFR